MEILRPFGELVTVKRYSKSPTITLSVLVRLKSSTSMSMDVDLSIRMGRFNLLLTGQ